MNRAPQTLDELQDALRKARSLENQLKYGEESVRKLRLRTYESMQDLAEALQWYGAYSDKRRVGVLYQELRDAFPGICRVAELRLAAERRQVSEHLRQLKAMLKQVEEVMADSSLETEEEEES